MKKIVTLLILAIGLFVSSCEVEPPTPDCELYDYGEVTVVNKTEVWHIIVDVTYTETSINDEKRLFQDGSYSYRMDAGKIYIWASANGNDWFYDTYYLKACENLTYTWYYVSGKKSTNSGLYSIVEVDGVAVDTLYNFEVLEK